MLCPPRKSFMVLGTDRQMDRPTEVETILTDRVVFSQKKPYQASSRRAFRLPQYHPVLWWVEMLSAASVCTFCLCRL